MWFLVGCATGMLLALAFLAVVCAVRMSGLAESARQRFGVGFCPRSGRRETDE